jgi:hypothetical protein
MGGPRPPVTAAPVPRHIPKGRYAAHEQTMAGNPERRAWTPEEVKREEAAERARVRRDAARG